MAEPSPMSPRPLRPSGRPAARRRPTPPRSAAVTAGLALLVTLAALGGCRSGQSTAESSRVRTTNDPPVPGSTGPRTPAQLAALEDAEAARASGDYEKALELFRSILAGNPSASDAYLGIGRIYLDQDDPESAEPVLARAARLEPRSFDAQYLHGEALQLLGRFVEAVRAYHRALTIRPDDLEANRAIATSYLHLEQPESAVVFARKAVELDPDDGPARVNLGVALQRTGRTEASIDAYVTALELIDEADAPPVMRNLLHALADAQRFQEAANTAENLLRVAPSAEVWERLGWARFRLGEFDASAEAYRRAVELDPQSWAALNGVGVNALNRWLLSDRSDGRARLEAREAFRRSLRWNIEQPKVVALLAQYDLR